jgi:hypothetical protein
MSWWRSRRALEYVGGVAFRGKLPPRAEDFEYLAELGVGVRLGERGGDVLFRLELDHPEWGRAALISMRGIEPPPALLLDFDPRLLPDERELARLAGSMVSVTMSGDGENVLRDRKKLLRYLRAVMGDDGVVAVDHGAQALWSKAGLDEELCHDADLDILSLFTVHCIADRDERPFWVHTHGFKEMGYFDFDVLDPSPELSGQAWDVMRALAFAVVEGRAEWDGRAIEVVGGRPAVRFVPAETFRKLAGSGFPDWLDEIDDEHLDGHAVACDPADRGLFGLRRPVPRPSTLLSGEQGDGPLQFSVSASDLMAERARATWPVFRGLFEEFRPLELRPLVKLWYGAAGDSESREHLWFEVEGCGPNSVDATLANDPWQDIGFGAGDRRVHDLERLSDWMILTPMGSITPRSLGAARSIRAHRGEIEELLRAAREAGEGSGPA